MKVSFLLPVARESYQDVIQSWLENTPHEVEEEWLISFDTEIYDRAGIVPEHLFDSCALTNHTVPDGDIVSVWNDLAADATGDLIVVIADDFYCVTEDWLQYIPTMDEPKIYYGNDGIQGQNLPTHPIYTRKAYEIMGYVFPPAYKAWYTDNELKAIARVVGMLEYLPSLKCDHRHWVNEKAKKDEIYQKGQATAEEGKRLYHERLKNGQMQAEVNRIWRALHE